VYDHEVRAQTPGGAFTVIWGCHGMDWNESPSHCFAESYVFGGHNGLADVGVTRSIGTERTEWLFMLLGQLPSLAEAYACYLDSMYDPEWIHSQWPSDTTECFVFDCALFGNPFWIPAGCVGMDESEFRAGTYMRLAAGPNPSADRVNLFCRLPSACRLELVISDAAGREVWSSLDRMARPGVHVSVWDRRDSRGRPVSSGIYFCRLLAGEYRETRKLLLVE